MSSPIPEEKQESSIPNHASDKYKTFPCPEGLEETKYLRNGRKLLIRPIRPEDEEKHFDFFDHETQEDLQLRFFQTVKRPSHEIMVRFTNIDYEREMAFIALGQDGNEKDEELGVVRVIANDRKESAEFSILLRSDMKGQGIGYVLLEKAIQYCRIQGYKEVVGEVLSRNHAMLRLAETFGFAKIRTEDMGLLKVKLTL